METNASQRSLRPTPEQANELLASSREAQEQIARSLSLPRYYSLATGTGNAMLVAGVAARNSGLRLGSVAFGLGLLANVGLRQWAIGRFKALNGAWIGGHQGGRATWVVIGVFLGALLACLGLATWLTVRHQALFAAAVAVATLPMTFVADRWWMERYRARAQQLGAPS
jgi:hypothetical protein